MFFIYMWRIMVQSNYPIRLLKSGIFYTHLLCLERVLTKIRPMLLYISYSLEPGTSRLHHSIWSAGIYNILGPLAFSRVHTIPTSTS